MDLAVEEREQRRARHTEEGVRDHGDIKNATLAVSVDNGAKALLNGKTVLQNPDWSSPTKADAKSFLQRGKNELRLEARNNEGVAAAVAVLSLEFADGKKLAIETGPDWSAAPAGSSDFKPAVAIAKIRRSTVGGSARRRCHTRTARPQQ
jgi:hypothetical protein